MGIPVAGIFGQQDFVSVGYPNDDAGRNLRVDHIAAGRTAEHPFPAIGTEFVPAAAAVDIGAVPTHQLHRRHTGKGIFSGVCSPQFSGMQPGIPRALHLLIIQRSKPALPIQLKQIAADLRPNGKIPEPRKRQSSILRKPRQHPLPIGDKKDVLPRRCLIMVAVVQMMWRDVLYHRQFPSFRHSAAASSTPILPVFQVRPPCIQTAYGSRIGPSADSSIDEPRVKAPAAIITSSL